ncbi:MAG TPA: hypothetical protein VJ486_02180 [Geothrix sp.]|nr:hypothetical protein [Geothrix sp.]
MSLRTLPPSERSNATWGMLALAVLFGLGLAAIVTRELRPPVSATPAQSRLLAVLKGVMAPHVSPDQYQQFKTWVASGATREGYAQVEPVVSNTCASCHGAGGQFPRLTSFEDLRPIALEPAPSALLDLVSPRALHLIVLPLILLVAVAAYLRRTAWRGRKLLMVGVALAALFDMAQWWVRQGRPEAFWAPWTATAALGLAMAAMTVAVLWELHGTKAG